MAPRALPQPELSRGSSEFNAGKPVAGFRVATPSPPYDVAWTASDNIGVVPVAIVLSADGGLTYTDTLATGEANDGVYPWNVTQARATTARIKVIAYDAAGNDGEDASDSDFEIYDPASGIAVPKDIPTGVLITGSCPNPFTRTTQIGFGIPAGGQVKTAAYDVGRRLVDVLMDQSLPAGYHSVTWRSGSLETGLYFVRVRLGREEVTHKLVLSR